ncbi:MAG: type II secretion system protein N [Gammaproteobacteria bacterium]|nr:type II secretion system protein N [Gammaproteobacteria bacterium]NVK86806.1 type II secretion system protein N [Gammaproteobacteria bacterium]
MLNKKFFFYSLLFIIFLLATLPARTALNLLPSNLGLSAKGVSGSIWSGEAASVSFNRFTVNNLVWSINPLHLFTGKIGGGVTLENEQMQVAGDWKIGFDSAVYLSDVEADVSAKMIEPYLPMRGTRIEGDLKLQLETLEFDPEQGPMAVAGDIQWRKAAASIMGPLISLGDFSLRAETSAPGVVELVALPAENVVDLQGSMTLTWPSMLAVDISVTESVPESLQSTIAFLQQGPQGRRVFKQELPLRR